MEKDDNFRRIEKLLYEFKTYTLAIKNLKYEIDTHCMPTCITNYSEDPVSFTVGDPSDSTGNHALRRVKDSEYLDELKARLKDKERNQERILEVIALFNPDERIIWERRYMKDEDVAVIYDSVGWSKTTYFRIRKSLVIKVRKCLGEI